MTQKDFKEFRRELGILMSKYNIRVKASSEEVIFGREGIIISDGDGRFHVERAVDVLFLEVLMPEEAKREKEEGTLIIESL